MNDNITRIQKRCLHCPSTEFYVTEGYTMSGRIDPKNPSVIQCEYGHGSTDGVLYFECANCEVRYSTNDADAITIR